MRSTRPNIIFLILSIALFYSPSAQSANKTKTLHKFLAYEMGYGTFNFKEKLDHKLVFPVANITAGLAYGRLSYILNASGSISDADVSEEEQTGNASRKDYDFTLGYQINKLISVFTGYKQGQTDVNLVIRESLMQTGGGMEYYKQAGPYIGLNLNKSIKDAGKFSFSISYAYLNSDSFFIEDGDEPDPGEPPEFDDASGQTSGNTRGYSYSLNWTIPLKGSFLFRTRLRINQYKQDIDYFDNVYGYGDIKFKDINESSTMLLIGVTRIF